MPRLCRLRRAATPTSRPSCWRRRCRRRWRTRPARRRKGVVSREFLRLLVSSASISKRRRLVIEFKQAIQSDEADATTATAHLPGVDIEIVHGGSPDGDAEQISINLQAVPSFEAFGRFLESGGPFAFWAQAARLPWFPWLGAMQAAMLPWNLLLLPPPKAGSEHS